ncbi:ribonuclease P protein component [Kushneria phosphatilytica]|uniref:Ribonuclease P protein component n=2 Tax=Kushneria phosphatilytica TaxID=657387 RepID=A0A5C1A363_9GAMM|nr:ribonuclease P protein component [Kushneria phosphatilytica]QEL12636.1 ribonuclease P protein component [Kushneria phosphatilytica]
MSPKGFPRRMRLLSSGDYRQVFEQTAFRIHGRGFLALAIPNRQGHVRVGLVISRKNARRAVDRNRLKRLIRESVRHRQHWLPAVDIVVLARRDASSLDNDTITRQLHGMWRRLTKEVGKQTDSAPPDEQNHRDRLKPR